MANGFDSSKITRQLRSPRNLLEFADISIQPRQTTTAEVIANTLDDAFERASQTYLQGKQLDAQVQQQQIQSDLRREQIDVQQRQFQANQDRATDNVLMESLKDINLKTEAEFFEQGIGNKNSIIGQVIELSKNKNLPMGDIFDEVLKGLSGKELVKQKKELNDFYIKYEEDKIHYQSQLDGISLSLNPDGTFADPAALTYIQKNYSKFETFNSAYITPNP